MSVYCSLASLDRDRRWARPDWDIGDHTAGTHGATGFNATQATDQRLHEGLDVADEASEVSQPSCAACGL